MHRSRAAEGVHRHAPRIFAALAEMSARRIGHVLVDDLVNSPSYQLDRHVESFGEPRQRLARAFQIELHLSAEKIVRIEIAEDQISVGHRGFHAALSIASRPRVCAGTIRSNFE